jgi:acetolactate decarboxylase
MREPARLPLSVALLLLLLVVGSGCTSSSRDAGVAWQNSTIDALLDGNYDGDVTFDELRKHGDFGLGTFDALDGEMLAVGGAFYQVRSNGQVDRVHPKQLTPFSVVTFFRRDQEIALHGPLSYADLQQALAPMRALTGRAYAIRIRGTFDAVRTRSVPRQDKPYRPLADVVKTQATFDVKKVRGTLVGFWFPESMRHANVPGYHFHFITDDATAGGHVLDLTLRDGVAEVQELSAVHIELPRRAPTTRATARGAGELEAVEK